jgi:hypothetical protein
MIELNEINSNVAKASRRNTGDDNGDNVANNIGTIMSDDEQSSNSSNSSHYSAASGESSANELLSTSRKPATMLPADSLELINDNYRPIR